MSLIRFKQCPNIRRHITEQYFHRYTFPQPAGNYIRETNNAGHQLLKQVGDVLGRQPTFSCETQTVCFSTMLVTSSDGAKTTLTRLLAAKVQLQMKRALISGRSSGKIYACPSSLFGQMKTAPPTVLVYSAFAHTSHFCGLTYATVHHVSNL